MKKGVQSVLPLSHNDDTSSMNELPLVQIREKNYSNFIQNESIATDQTNKGVFSFKQS